MPASDARRRACDPDRRASRRSSLAGRTALRSQPDIESLAAREGKTERSIRMTLSLAFLAPAIVKAAIDGRLPRGFGLKRLMDLPMAWPDQWRRSGSRRQRRRNERSDPARLSSGDELIHPIRTGSQWRGSNPKGRSKSARWARGKQQPWKRKFAAGDFRPRAPAKSRKDGRIDPADRLLPRKRGNSRGIVRTGNPRRFAPDFLVVDAVL